MKITNEARARRWEEKIVECRASNTSMSKWCQANDEKQSAMKYWIRKLGMQQRKKPVSKKEIVFCEMNIIGDDKDSESIIDTEVSANRNERDTGVKIKAGTFEIVVSEGFDARTLETVLKAVKFAC